MRRLFSPSPLAAVMVVILTGLAGAGGLAACSSKPEERLNGRWAVDVEAMVTRETLKDQLKGLNPEAQEQRLAAARAEAARITLEIDSGKMVVDTGVDRKETRFTVQPAPTGEKTDKVVLETDDGNGHKGTLECRFEGDKLEMTWDGTPLVFIKR